MIRVETTTYGLEEKVKKIKLAVSDGGFDQPVDAAAWKAHAQLVELTPKKYTGNTRKAWGVKTPQLGQRLVYNDSKAMLWLEEGTGNAGTATSRGGYIYPKSKSVLFIPLNARAALGGWDETLQMGKDYILRRRVRGIKPRKIVAEFKPKAEAILRTEVVNFLKKALT